MERDGGTRTDLAKLTFVVINASKRTQEVRHTDARVHVFFCLLPVDLRPSAA